MCLVLHLRLVPLKQTTHQVAERLAACLFCSWSNQSVQWYPPLLQRVILTGRLLFKSWEPAWDLWSKWGPFLWAVAADLKGDRPGGNLYLEVIYELPLMVALTAFLALVKYSISLRNGETECGVLCDWSTFFSSKEKCRCPSHIGIAWKLYFSHLHVLLSILQYLLEDMIEWFSGEFICI